jgi:hypothetical protein
VKIGTIAASIFLILHGLVHLLGAASYTKLAVIQQLPYKTTFLGGLDLGVGGMAVYGGLWAVATIGFIVSAVALLAVWKWWKPALVGVTVLSLALTALVWSDAPIGVIVNGDPGCALVRAPHYWMALSQECLRQRYKCQDFSRPLTTSVRRST